MTVHVEFPAPEGRQLPVMLPVRFRPDSARAGALRVLGLQVVATWVLTCFAWPLPAQDFRASRLTAHPSAVDLSGAAAEHGLIVTAIDASGRRIDVTRQARYSSARPDLIVVSTNGSLRALTDNF